MECAYCGGKTEVTNSRLQKRSNQIWRRRRCLICLAVFTTHESTDLAGVARVRSNNQLKPFNEDVLFTEVSLALQDRKNCFAEAREITNTVIQRLVKTPEFPVIEARDISQTTAKVLKRFNRRSWQRYLLEHPSLQK